MVDVELGENTRYWWRANAADAFVAGPWSEIGTFVVDADNEAPSVPTAVSPDGSADTVSPDFVVDESTDPEGDAFVYVWEVFSDEDLSDLVGGGESEEPTWMLEDDLSEDVWYWWRAAARDELGAQSDWSDTLVFLVNTQNNLPEAPVFVRPHC